MGTYRVTPNYVARKSIWPAFLVLWKFIVTVVCAAGIVVLKLVGKNAAESTANIFNIIVWVLIGVLAVIALTVLWQIIKLRCHTIEFYNGCVIEKWGVFIRSSKKTVFPRITAMSTRRNILGYGNIYIDVVGPAWDISFRDMARPNKLRNFLSYYMLNDSAVESISNNPYIAATDGLFR